MRATRGANMDTDILSKINRRQRQILVHSCLYYQFNENLIQDHVYDAWSKELAELIQNHKEEFKRSVHHTSFKDYDGCSGFDLPFSDPMIVGVAESLLHNRH